MQHFVRLPTLTDAESDFETRESRQAAAAKDYLTYHSSKLWAQTPGKDRFSIESPEQNTRVPFHIDFASLLSFVVGQAFIEDKVTLPLIEWGYRSDYQASHQIKKKALENNSLQANRKERPAHALANEAGKLPSVPKLQGSSHLVIIMA